MRVGSDLFEQPPLLYDIGNCLHLDTLCLVDVLQSIQISCLLVLDHTDLGLVMTGRRKTARQQAPCQRHPSPHNVKGRSGKASHLRQNRLAASGSEIGVVREAESSDRGSAADTSHYERIFRRRRGRGRAGRVGDSRTAGELRK